MNSADENMRRFQVVAQYAMQTNQVYHKGFCPREGHRNLRDIATADYGLTEAEYKRVMKRARDFLHKIRNSKTSDDMLAEQRIKLAA